MEFDLPKGQSSIIKVIGVGGGGSNAVNHMYNLGIKGVDFLVCNTDRQALDVSPVPLKIQLGPSLTEGRGAGSIPEIGMNAAVENIDELKDILSHETKMIFVTAGMGGGTGTGAAPVIAKIARELGILTVGIVTVPFNFEGRKRRQQAEEGLENMRQNVDTLLVINNERLREISGNLTLGNAFAQADNVLAIAAKGIAEVISVTGAINVDFNDVNTVMKDSGVAIMGSADAEGENRAIEAVQSALTSPLLNDNDIQGAKYVLLNITYGDKEVLMDEISDITDYIQNEAGSTADVIWGHGYDETMGEKLGVTLIATGFNQNPVTGFEKEQERKVTVLEDEVKKEITTPLESAIGNAWNNDSEEKEKTIKEPAPEPYLKSEEAEVEAQDSIEEILESTEVPQMDFNWEITSSEDTNKTEDSSNDTVSEEQNTDVKRYFLDDEVESKVETENTQTILSPEEQQQRAQERMDRIQKYTGKIKNAEGLTQLESEPAYKRRKIVLDDETTYSSEQKGSRFDLSDDGENGTELRGNNSFLHDNVD